MNGKYLLDTNIVIALLGREQSIEKRLLQSDEFFISTVVLGELYFGARKSNRISENLAIVDEFANQNTILDCNVDTSREYGIIKEQLRRKGKPIPENDIWLAAIARQYNVVLITRDKHFSQIDGLKQEIW